MNYKNQTRINIKKFDTITHKENSSNQFLQPIDWQYYDEALKTLSSNAFKLWLYLLRWAGKGYYEFSPTHLCDALNISSRNTIKAARDELIRENYLVQVKPETYEFYPCGHADLIVKN